MSFMPPKPRSAKEWGELTARISALLAIIISCGVLYKEHFLSPNDLEIIIYKQGEYERRIQQNEETLRILTDVTISLAVVNQRLLSLEESVNQLKNK